MGGERGRPSVFNQDKPLCNRRLSGEMHRAAFGMRGGPDQDGSPWPGGYGTGAWKRRCSGGV